MDICYIGLHSSDRRDISLFKESGNLSGVDIKANNLKVSGNFTIGSISYDQLKYLEGLEQKTMELKEKLQKIKSDAEQERALNLEETYQLNSDITDKNFEINVLSGENRDLIAQLKEIKNSLDEKMKIGNKFLVKMEKL